LKKVKKHLTQFKVGQMVQAEVLEKMSSKEFIVNFQGDLVRVANQTGQKIQKGQTVNLIVRSLQPLSFSLAAKHQIQGLHISV